MCCDGRDLDSKPVPNATMAFSSKKRCYNLGLVSNELCSDEEQEQALIAAALMDPHTKDLNLASLPLTGVDDFQLHIPGTAHHVIKATFRGHNSSSTGHGREPQDYETSKTLQGPILKMLLDAVSWVQSLQREPKDQTILRTGSNGINETVRLCQYALEALKELIMNDLVHCSLENEAPIQLLMTPQTVRLIVPGMVSPCVGLLNGDPSMHIRHPKLWLRLLQVTDPETNRRYFEGKGSGIQLAKHRQDELGGSITFLEQVDHLIVTIQAAPVLHRTMPAALTTTIQTISTGRARNHEQR